LRLARLHNVNHYIVSQTNPHVVPFLREHNPRRRRRVGALACELATVAGRDALRVARNHLGAGSSRIVDQLNEILQQRYSGDISILPRQTPAQLVRLLANPSSEDIRRFIREGQRATWPKLTRTATQTRISRAFENCLAWLKERGAQSSALDKASALHGSAMRLSRPSRPN
jgi:TAG lipase/steryl ester hydrolase/phospholipase A2/LPA acyltransferase